MMVIHSTKKAKTLLRKSGFFNDLRKKVSFEKDITIANELFHWHLNVTEKSEEQLLILTHDVSGVAVAIRVGESSTLKRLDSLLPLIIENVFLRAKCSRSFIDYYLEHSTHITFSASREAKYISKNSFAGKHIKANKATIDTDRLLQSHLTNNLNDMPRKSLEYKSPNQLLKTISQATC